MFGYTLSNRLYTANGKILRPEKCLGYNFKNDGNTIALISTKDATPEEQPIILYPNEAMDTRLIGGMDLTNYIVSFKSVNDVDPESQQSQLFVITFAAI